MQPSSVTDFLANLPPDVNPYLATANMLENSVHSPRSPPWARRLSVATIIFFTIMLLQAVYLVFQKVRVQTPKMKFNKLGLVVFDLSYATGIGFSLTASLTVTVLVLERISDSGHRVRESVIALLFGHQFMPILITAWALSWFGTCQCALAFWNSNAAFNLNRKRLQAFLQWGLSATFLLASFGPIIACSWTYAIAYVKLRRIESVIHQITSILRTDAEHYDPNGPNQLRIVTTVMPVQELAPLQKDLGNCLQRSLGIYCAVISLLVLITLPLISMSLRGLYKRTIFQWLLDTALGRAPGVKPSKISKELLREREKLVNYSLCVIFSTAVHLPPLISELSQSPMGYFQSSKRKQVTHLGLTVPFSITGNIILLILNLHAGQLVREKKKALKTLKPSGLRLGADKPPNNASNKQENHTIIDVEQKLHPLRDEKNAEILLPLDFPANSIPEHPYSIHPHLKFGSF